jgi:hypothetical protein
MPGATVGLLDGVEVDVEEALKLRDIARNIRDRLSRWFESCSFRE